MTKLALKEKTVELRKKGFSYNLILKQISVSRSSLSLWLKDVPFSPNAIVQNRIKGAALASKRWSNAKKRNSLAQAKKEAAQQIGTISDRDLFMLGLGVYIGEGAKTHNNPRFINSDPQVIRLAIQWFKKNFGLNTNHFSPIIHLYPDNDVQKALAFWERVTGIPRCQFGKTQVDRRPKKSKKRGLLKYGTLDLYVRSRGIKEFGVLLFRKILAMIDEVHRQA